MTADDMLRVGNLALAADRNALHDLLLDEGRDAEAAALAAGGAAGGAVAHVGGAFLPVAVEETVPFPAEGEVMRRAGCVAWRGTPGVRNAREGWRVSSWNGRQYAYVRLAERPDLYNAAAAAGPPVK